MHDTKFFQNKKPKHGPFSCSFSDECPIQGREISVKNGYNVFSCHIYWFKNTIYKNIKFTYLVEQKVHLYINENLRAEVYNFKLTADWIYSSLEMTTL